MPLSATSTSREGQEVVSRAPKPLPPLAIGSTGPSLTESGRGTALPSLTLDERQDMSRTAKAVVAGALGLTLLSGAGATFSEWHESEDLGSGSIDAGHLDMSVANPTWSDQNGTIDPAAFRMVPGDTVTYAADVTPDLDGDNLTATLQVDESQMSGDMAQFVDVTTTVGGQANAVLDETDSGTAVPVRVQITMPFSTGADNGTDGERTTLDLTSVHLSLVQNPNPPA